MNDKSTTNRMIADIRELRSVVSKIVTQQENDHDKIEENKSLIVQIHKLSAAIEHLSAQQTQTQKALEQIQANIDKSLISQGERIGNLERIAERRTVEMEGFSTRLKTVEKDVEEMKLLDGKKYQSISMYVILGVIGAVLAATFALIGLR